MIRKIVSLSVVTFLLLFVVISPVAAQDQPAKTTTLPSGEVFSHDYFAANENVQILGTVNGDVYAAGEKVIINGVINGDIIVAGGVVTIGGVVTQDIRVAGGTVQIVGKVTKNITVAGGTVLVSPEAKVGGNMLIFGGTTELDGTINGDVRAYAQNLTITNAKINGNVEYWSKRDALIAGDASVKGQITKHETSQKTQKWMNDAEKTGRGFHTATKAGSFLTTLMIGLIIIRLFPKYVKRAKDIMDKEKGKAFFRGSVAMIVIPVVLILMAITIIGLPLAVILSIVFAIYLYTGRLFALIAIGSYILKRTKHSENVNRSFLVGLIVYYLLSFIPIIGGIATLLIVVTGLGAAITNDRRTWAISRGSHVL